MLDSKESISTFIEMGRTVSELTTIDYLNFYSQLIKDEKVIHYGVFHGWKMLAYASYGPAFHPNGLQIVYFVRNEYLKQNIGTFTLGKMTTQAWLEHDVHFVQAVIDCKVTGVRTFICPDCIGARHQGFRYSNMLHIYKSQT
jgi:hypothetical protein